MPRDGSGIYTLPFPDVVTDTVIASTVHNGIAHDVATDLNTPRPIVAGGTGASSAAAARTALTAETYGQVVTNYDSFAFLPGSFYSDAAATNPPVAGHAFAGVCAFVDANNMYLEAFDRDDAAQPGAMWIRQKKAGVWSAWAKAQALNIVGSPAANQFTTWQSGTALQGVAITGLVKGNGASAPSAAVAKTDYAPPTSGTALLKGDNVGGFAAAVANTDYLPASSPAITGSPTAPTPPVDDNDTSLATTAFVIGQAGGSSPLADAAAAAVGTSLRYSRQDHVHPQTGVATVKVQKFTASGTYTPSAGMIFCIIECWGAGGGGGACANAGANTGQNGAGGGAGGKSRKYCTAADIGASKSVTIGAKGTGGAAGGPSAGTNGGDTSVGVLCIAKGGSGGSPNTGGGPANSGPGGIIGTGDIAVPGQAGAATAPTGSGTHAGVGGMGGSSDVGSGGVTNTANPGHADGGAASGFAAGGGGGQSYNGGGAAAGGDGAPGLSVITEFCTQ